MTVASERTVLITGVAGFLGRYVAREFARLSWRVIGVDVVAAENAPPAITYYQMTLPDSALESLIVNTRPAACTHCAGRASVGFSLRDPAADFRDSVDLTFEILDTLRRVVPNCRTLVLSSAAVYGNPESLPVVEDHRPAPLSPYGYHKLICELLVQEFATLFSLPTVAVRIFSAYGPGLRRQVVWDICERALTEGSLTLHGTGHESRDFIHAADVATAVAVLVDKAPFQGERYNLATGVETTIASLAESLLKELGVAGSPQFDGETTPGDPRNWRADVTRLAQLGFSPRLSLHEGLRGVAAWARAELVSAA